MSGTTEQCRAIRRQKRIHSRTAWECHRQLSRWTIQWRFFLCSRRSLPARTPNDYWGGKNSQLSDVGTVKLRAMWKNGRTSTIMTPLWCTRCWEFHISMSKSLTNREADIYRRNCNLFFLQERIVLEIERIQFAQEVIIMRASIAKGFRITLQFSSAFTCTWGLHTSE